MTADVRPGTPHTIVALRALQLGDMLCAVPAFRALRAGVPDASITLVSLPWARAFADRFRAYVDEFIEFPGHEGLPERPVDRDALPRFFSIMRDRRFDLALQMHGDGRVSNAIIERFGALETAGFSADGAGSAPGRMRVRYPDELPERQRLLGLTRALGCEDVRGDALEFPITDADRAALASLPGAARIAGEPYACLFAGSRDPARRWPPEAFAAVADELSRAGLGIVLAGAAGERGIAAAVRTAMRGEAIDLCGVTSLGSLAALIERATLVVCNDSGPSHLADALGVPSVIASLGSEPHRWSPADTALHRYVEVSSAGDGAVTAAALELLDRRRVYAA